MPKTLVTKKPAGKDSALILTIDVHIENVERVLARTTKSPQKAIVLYSPSKQIDVKNPKPPFRDVIFKDLLNAVVRSINFTCSTGSSLASSALALND